MDPFKLLLSAFKRLTTAITSPFRMLIVRFQRLFNINIITSKLVAPLTKKVKALLGLRPKTEADYVTVGRFWVFKKLFLTLILVVCAGVILYFSMVAPPLPTQPVQPAAVKTDVDFDYDDMELGTYSGVANIRAADGSIVYTGDVDKGVCSGSGTLYTREGKRLYEGEFAHNQYEGRGVQYYPEGGVHYEGDFAANRYSGPGKLYDRQGRLLYDGTFKDGLYDGEGKAYRADGTLAYEGGYSRGEYHGIGIGYNPDGGIHYEGEYYEGQPQGEGVLYSEAGKQLYIGSMYQGEINYRALVSSTLAEVETAFAETPRVYYGDNDSCFVFEQAGVIISTDCRVQVDVWEKHQTEEEKASQFYYMPGERGTAPMSRQGPAGIPSIGYLGKARPEGPGVQSASWFVPSGPQGGGAPQPQNPSAQADPGGAPPQPPAPPAAPLPLPETPAPTAPPPAATGPAPQIILPEQEEKKPDFVEKDLTLYYEIDKNVWQSEDELDKSKVLVNKVTVMNKPAARPVPETEPYDDNLPPSIEDCVAIDHARQTEPTIFSNILFEMDKQNKLFVRLKNISYAERIVQRSYNVEGLTYRCSFPIDRRDTMVYYSIERQ